MLGLQETSPCRARLTPGLSEKALVSWQLIHVASVRRNECCLADSCVENLLDLHAEVVDWHEFICSCFMLHLLMCCLADSCVENLLILHAEVVEWHDFICTCFMLHLLMCCLADSCVENLLMVNSYRSGGLTWMYLLWLQVALVERGDLLSCN